MSTGGQPVRKRLGEMEHHELQTWLLHHRAALEDFCSSLQDYVQRRARRGVHTLTDVRYERFLAQASDLLAGLEELRQATEQAAAQEEQ